MYINRGGSQMDNLYLIILKRFIEVLFLDY